MSAFFNSDGSFPLQFLTIFAVIFAVLAAIVLIYRRFSGKGTALSKSGPRGRQPRLGIVDIYELDRQRQLILLRRDNVEHLLLVGGPNDVIVERNINRGAGVRLPLDETARVEPLPEESAFEPARPGDPPAASAPPVYQPPIVQSPPSPAMISERPDARSREPLSSSSVPTPPAEEVAARRDAAAETVPAGRPSRAEVIAAKAARRNPPPLANLRAEAPERQRETAERPSDIVEPTSDAPGPASQEKASAPAAAVPAKPAQPQPAREPSPAVEQAPPMPLPLARPTSSRPVDAAILSDMARQLEEALRRPSAAVSSSAPGAPPQTQVTPPAPQAERKAPAKPEPDREPVPVTDTQQVRPVDPMAAAMAATQDVAPEPAPPARTRTQELAPVQPAPVEPEPFLPAPPPPPQPIPPQPAPVPEIPAPRRAAAPSQNPFSVEEIEAEFARLLGRPLDKKG